ncbi:MAG: transporter [Microbacteriaceae bacterium]|nr:transporter [Microbacteriaceae bacterium]
MWGVGAFAYLVAVMQRSSLGVSGVVALDRFDVNAAALSTLAVVQLVVYAALQVPVGVLLDRFGPKVLIASGAVLMLVGQATLALAPSIGVAVLGRVLVGAGDAATFISVIRLLASWFRGRILPQLSQWTGNIGQLGQVVSAIPFAFALHAFGWTPAFLSAASASAIAAVLVLLLVTNGQKEPGDLPMDASGGIRRLREALARPGTQLGFWSHFTTQSSGTVFSLLWGFPFLTAGLGYSNALASALLTTLVLAGVVSGPIIGILTARYPLRRSAIVLSAVSLMGIAWAVLLLWPGTPPFWVVVAMIVAIGVGGPGSLIGFDFARTFNPLRSLGSANGIVNVGGFLASFVMMYLIGLILDALNRARIAAGGASDLFSWESFRIAFAVQFLVVGTGVVFLLLARKRTRMRLREEEGVEVAPLWIAVARALRRRNV